MKPCLEHDPGIMDKYFCLLCGQVVQSHLILESGFPQWLEDYVPKWELEPSSYLLSLFAAWEAAQKYYLKQLNIKAQDIH